jgi:hypothetical protein
VVERGNGESIGDHRPGVIHEVICVFCGKRWVSVSDPKLVLRDYDCESCDQTGGVILTGQPLDGEFVDSAVSGFDDVV